MTATTDFDGVVASWLQGAGPTFVRNEVVEEALVKARRVGQRHGLAALVFGPAAWPSHRSRLLLAGLPPVVRLAVLVALTLAALVGVAAVGAQLLRQPSPPAYRGVFVPAADMAFGRTNAVVVPLVDGRVLIAAGRDSFGGRGDVPAEVLDPATGKLTAIALDAPHGQEGGSGVELPDGRVFMIVRDGNTTSSGAWIVDPATMTSRQLPPGGFSSAPVFGVSPSLALLLDGRVLVAGGLNDVYGDGDDNVRATALLFDPATETFALTGSMSRPRWRHTMTTLPDGRVLVAGGEGWSVPEDRSPPLLDDAEIYEPVTGTFTSIGSMPRVRGATLAVPLPDGRVVVLPRWGSFSQYRNFFGEPQVLDDPASEAPVDIFDPATGMFAPVGSTPGAATSATLLRTGKVLLTGHNAIDNGPWRRLGFTIRSLVLDPVDGRVEPGPAPRAIFPAATRLADGRVLLAGGWEPMASGGWPGIDVPWVDIFE